MRGRVMGPTVCMGGPGAHVAGLPSRTVVAAVAHDSTDPNKAHALNPQSLKLPRARDVRR